MYGFCEFESIEHWMSSAGVNAFADDQSPFAWGGTDKIENAIQQAESEMMYSLQGKYNATTLVGNLWVRHNASFIAACCLCLRLGRPIPDPWLPELKRIRAQLKEIRDGNGQVPDAIMDASPMPGFVNTRVDFRFRNAKTRRDVWTSVPRMSQLQQFVDIDAYNYVVY